MRGWTRVAGVVTATWLGAGFAAAAYALSSESGKSGGEPLGPGAAAITLHVNHSRFRPDQIDVRAGTEVTFRVVNHDPIGHELIVGDDEVHARHESGTHGRHGAVPGEVSVGPGETATTTFEFDDPGTVLFACHLPRHFDYGMVGEVVVSDS